MNYIYSVTQWIKLYLLRLIARFLNNKKSWTGASVAYYFAQPSEFKGDSQRTPWSAKEIPQQRHRCMVKCEKTHIIGHIVFVRHNCHITFGRTRKGSWPSTKRKACFTMIAKIFSQADADGTKSTRSIRRRSFDCVRSPLPESYCTSPPWTAPAAGWRCITRPPVSNLLRNIAHVPARTIKGMCLKSMQILSTISFYKDFAGYKNWSYNKNADGSSSLKN